MKVVVIGAGYAGTIAANALARKKLDGLEVTVVNERADFVERVRLHEHLAGTGTALTPLAQMLRDAIAVRVGSIEKIGDGQATLDDGTIVDYDHAILAVGSGARPIPGTLPVGTWQGASQAREALAGARPGQHVTVVGGGLTGIETAAEIAEARRDLRVRLVSPNLGASLSDSGRRRVRRGLERLDVAVVHGTVERATPDSVHLESGEELRSSLTLWSVVSGVPDLAARSGLATDDDGRAVVDACLRSVTDERIFAVGDCAAVPGSRPSCQAAVPQGAHAANVLEQIAIGGDPAHYSMGFTNQAVSLGRTDGLIQWVRRDDTPRRAHLAGRPAALVKESICRGAKTVAHIGWHAWLPGPR